MENNRPKFDGTISLGNMLVVLSIVFSIVAAWVANRERTFNNAEAIQVLQNDVDVLEIRVRNLEITLGSSNIKGDR